MTANETYQKRVAKIKALLKEIEAGLEIHEQQQKEAVNNWGYVGEVGSIATDLKNIAESLKNATA